MKKDSGLFTKNRRKNRLFTAMLLIISLLLFILRDCEVKEIISRRNHSLQNPMQTMMPAAIFCGLILIAAVIFFLVTYWRKIDRTELCSMEAELDRAKVASQAKSDFLSDMSHELRTPMNAIVGLTALAKRSVEDKGKTLDYLQKLEVATSYMLSLINDILDMSRIERRKMVLYNIPFDFRDMIRAVDIVIRQMSGERNQNFDVDIEISNSLIVGDRARLQQVIVNLLNNAVKYTEEGGRICLKVRELSGSEGNVRLYVEVSDTGIGIRQQDLERIFEPFEEGERREGNGKVSSGGTGLGLSICRSILHLMGSEIKVESVPGRGSTFFFEAEFMKAGRELLPDSELSDGTWDLKGRRVIVAEDNDMNREMLMELLEDEGVLCDPAEDGEEALVLFENAPPGTYDAILMDIQMPKMDGLEASKKIRSLDHRDASRIPVVAMSAYAFTEDIERGNAAGMNEYITKPINIVELCKLLNHLVLTKEERL